MKGSLRIFRASWKILALTVRDLSAYRVNFFLSFLVIALPFFLQVFFWQAVAGDSGTVGPYTLSRLITYYILALLLHDFAFPTVRVEIAEDIKRGTLSAHLVHPYPYPLYAFFTLLGSHLVYLGAVISLILALVLGFRSFWVLSWADLGRFALIFLLAWSLGMVLSLSMSFLAFFLEDVWGLQRVITLGVPLFSGLILPLDLFPAPLRWLSLMFPFRWMVYDPIQVALGTRSFSGVALVILGWLLAGCLLACVLWRRGLRVYTATGG